MVSFPSLPDLPDGEFKTVMADPPWAYEDDLPGPASDGASDEPLHYGTVMGMGPQIRKVTAPHAHLYLWTTNYFMAEALAVADAWGFDQKSIITWVKVTDEPTGLPHERDGPATVKEHIGRGNYLRNTTEHMLFAVKGSRGVALNSVPSHFFAERTERRSKPEKAYRLAEQLSPARTSRSSRERNGLAGPPGATTRPPRRRSATSWTGSGPAAGYWRSRRGSSVRSADRRTNASEASTSSRYSSPFSRTGSSLRRSETTAEAVMRRDRAPTAPFSW
ncbi:MT-A70 family methyltransferase [Halobacteriaceae archaeon GCM10025711]